MDLFCLNFTVIHKPQHILPDPTLCLELSNKADMPQQLATILTFYVKYLCDFIFCRCKLYYEVNMPIQ